MTQNDTVYIIKCFVEGAKKAGNKHEKTITSVDENGTENTIFNCKYLLNQIIRNYRIPAENYHVSEAAMELWEKLTTQNIDEFYYVH